MRSRVVIVQIRAAEVQVGDVVNRRGPERTGWMEVGHVERLPGGELIISDESRRDGFTAADYDLVWLQTLEPLTTNSHIPLPARPDLA